MMEHEKNIIKIIVSILTCLKKHVNRRFQRVSHCESNVKSGQN